MANFNKVILIGNLTREPELRVTPGGVSICKFGLAVGRVFTDKSGEKREETLFIDVDAFGRSAETISKYMSKGRAILVEGRLKLDQWDDKNTGEKRSRIGVVLETFQFMGGRGEGEGGGFGGESSSYSGSEQHSSPEQHSPPARTPSPAKPPIQDDSDDDVPF